MPTHRIAVAVLTLATLVAHADAAPPTPAAEATTESTPTTAFDERVTALEIALATIVAERPALWRFDALEAEASALLIAAEDEPQRQAVRVIADRIDRFATLGRRHRDARGTKPAPQVAAKPKPSPSRPTDATKPKPKYDAVGELRAVVSKRADAPTYALVDENGKVTTLVTPSPDLDLAPLVGKRIGVRGARGFMPAYRREHLTANRVAPLETIRR